MTPANHTQPLPALLAALTAAAALVALTSPVALPEPALWHLIFAVGALPMIFAAMGYFVPVLTRTPEAPRRLAFLPLTAMLAGLGIVVWFTTGLPALRHAAPIVGMLAAAGLAGWMRLRWRRCLGNPHPCLHWYLAALACLILGLAAVALAAAWPAQAHRLRLVHLHLNLLGFMGLTAIGTLQVLLPTVLGRTDPRAHLRLVRDLPWCLAGALGMALGSALAWPLAAVGAAAYAWPLLRLLHDLWQSHRQHLVAPGQPAALLLAAVGGLLGLLIHGAAHGLAANGRQALPVFVIAFLLPLVSGAVARLLPIWLRPGVQGEWSRRAQQRLSAHARTRAAVLPLAGALAAAGNAIGYLLGALAAAWLLAAMALTAFSSRRCP
jgi:hypothetical protein